MGHFLSFKIEIYPRGFGNITLAQLFSLTISLAKERMLKHREQLWEQGTSWEQLGRPPTADVGDR